MENSNLFQIIHTIITTDYYAVVKNIAAEVSVGKQLNDELLNIANNYICAISELHEKIKDHGSLFERIKKHDQEELKRYWRQGFIYWNMEPLPFPFEF